MKRGKHHKIKERKFTIISVLVIIILVALAYIIYFNYIDLKSDQQLKEDMSYVDTTENEIESSKSEKILQLEELKKKNNEIIGWLKIPDTNIDYPVLQTNNNDFYLTHNYMKEYSKSGSLFLDKNFNFELPSSNLLIYGHRNTNGLMFEDLMKYRDKNFYKDHKEIQFTSLTEDCEYEILSVFYSRVYYKHETNVFRYYYFVNAETDAEYNSFVNNCIKNSIYDTGVTAKYGEQLLTLSTCEYSRKDGRFVVVAKKKI